MSYDYGEIVPYLLHWYDYNARVLPWRENPKPYYVWISEIMLQQTRVEAVRGYFYRFIEAIPDIPSLATVDDEKLMKLWEGLGYYNRARNLKKAAQLIMSDFNGQLPSDYNELLKLPGIGVYTAGAIASIAFQQPEVAIDGNVLRIAKRIAGSFDDITKESVRKELWEDFKRIVPKDRPGDFNQSLMDLGAMVCIPNGKPHCEQCPIMHICQAFHQNLVMQIPVKPPKKKRRVEKRTVFLIEYQDRYLIRQREDKGLLAGLWELVSVEEKLTQSKLGKVLKEWEIEDYKVEPLGKAKHIFTHLEWHMEGYHIILNAAPTRFMEETSYVWASKEELESIYTLPSAFAAFTKGLF